RHTMVSRDWSSDVCSSDLQFLGKEGAPSQVAVDTAFYRLQLPQEKTQQGGLSGAVGADHQHPVPSLDGEGRSAKKPGATGIVKRSEERRVGKEGRRRRDKC